MAMPVRRVFVTGGNKGIGFANVAAILSAHADAFVFLGSRDFSRGEAARLRLPDAARARCAVVAIDVQSDASVAAAALAAAAAGPLHGVLLNAGVAGAGAAETFAVNLQGVVRCVAAFAPLLTAPGARVAVVSSGVGPMFVQKCAAARVAWFRDTQPSLEAVLAEAACVRDLIAAGDDAGLVERGYFARAEMGEASAAYHASKAFVNAAVQALAAAHPQLRVNGASPGFIDTDLVAAFVGGGKTPAAMGALPPERSTAVFERLLFGDVRSGQYFGSDAQRSPVHAYRSPGAPPYDGE
jgi:NAD(P)-dependent dehydrogenase (short-subunit alcohol dehydrogenase family)